MDGERRRNEQVFCESVHEPQLDLAAQHHLARVLRLRDGTRVAVTNGRGSWRWCRFRLNGLELDGPVVEEPRRGEEKTLAVALSKLEKPEWVVQKLTEIGIARIGFLQTERVVVKWDVPKRARMRLRFEEIAWMAMNQSRQVWLPEILPVTSYADWQPKVIADFEGELLDQADTTVLIGPEGGWSDAERSQAERRVRLGDSVLRCETAALVAGVQLVGLAEP